MRHQPQWPNLLKFQKTVFFLAGIFLNNNSQRYLNVRIMLIKSGEWWMVNGEWSMVNGAVPINPHSILKVACQIYSRHANFFLWEYSSAIAMANAASTLIIEPLEISKNRFLSVWDSLEQASAIIKHKDKAPLFICWAIANFYLQQSSLWFYIILIQTFLKFEIHPALLC